MPMGFSFQPGADQSMAGANGQTGRSVAPPSSSVKVLSFRMPKHDVRGAVAPSALLNAAGGAQTGGLSPQLLSLLMSAFSAGPQSLAQGGGAFDGGSSDPSGMAGPGLGNRALTPRFTIGDGGQDGGPFRLGDDLGAGFAAGGEMPFGEPMGRGGMASERGTTAPASSVSPGPRYKMGGDYQMLDDSTFSPGMEPFFR